MSKDGHKKCPVCKSKMVTKKPDSFTVSELEEFSVHYECHDCFCIYKIILEPKRIEVIHGGTKG